MNCPVCQTDNREGARFCNECGSPLAARCPACGADHRPGARFCDACGTALTDAPAPAAVAAASAGAELRVVSVLFVDLVGYTALSETRDAEDVRELLGRYFEQARTIVGRYGGVVEKFIGDAVMAVWGTPTAREDDAERAVRAGLELVDAVTAFGAGVGAPELRARAGVVTGQVASLANPGEGLVVGDRVNTASRVQSVALPGTVLADEVTRQASSAAIAYEDAGEHTVKGKAEPLRLWRAVRPFSTGAGRTEGGLDTPFVGRDAELRLVKDLFHSGVDRGAARLIAVAGPAGVGKSRLLQEFSDYLDGVADVVLWHSGRCLSYGEGVAYWALAEMVRQRLDIAEDAPPEEATRKLAIGLDRWISDPEERAFVAPRLGALIGAAEPGLGRADLFAGWRLFLERLSDQDPVVLAFEDVQWADDGLLDFIEYLLDWSASKPIAVLTLARPELAERRAGWPPSRPGVTPVFLEPLADEAVGELLDAVVTGLPAAAREQIVRQAEGIALYALETVRALADRGALVEHGDGGYVATGDVGELEVPATLSSLLTARLDALTREERSLVKDLAVMGGSFPRAAVVAVSGQSEERVDALLASLVRKQVLVVTADPLSPDRGQYAFAQTLLRTVAYDMLSRRERKPRHLAIARHLRSAFPNDGEEVAEVIAAHQLDAYRAAQGDDDAEELRVASLAELRRAARRAASIGAPATAHRLLWTAAETASPAERLPLVEEAARMAMDAGDHQTALELFDEAIAGHTAAGASRDAARATAQIGTCLRMLGRNGEAVERLRAALSELDTGELDPEVAALNATLGAVLAFSGRDQEAAQALDRALGQAQALGLHAVFCQALVDNGVRLVVAGRHAEAVGAFDVAERVAEREGLVRQLMRARLNAANTHLYSDPAKSADLSRAAIAIAHRLGDRAYENVGLGNLMHALRLIGEWAEADRLLGEWFRASNPSDQEFILTPGLFSALQRGRIDEARSVLADLAAWRESEDLEARHLHAVGTAVLAVADAAPGALDRLVALLCDELSSSHVFWEAPDLALPVAVDATLDAGRHEATAEVLDALAARPPGLVLRYTDAHLARGRALLAAARGEHDGVEERFDAALRAFATGPFVYWHARTRADFAAWLAAQGRGAEAHEHLGEAVPVLERLEAAPALERARATLAALQIAETPS